MSNDYVTYTVGTYPEWRGCLLVHPLLLLGGGGGGGDGAADLGADGGAACCLLGVSSGFVEQRGAAPPVHHLGHALTRTDDGRAFRRQLLSFLLPRLQGRGRMNKHFTKALFTIAK